MNRTVIIYLFIFLITSCVTQNIEKKDVATTPKTAKELIERINSTNKTPEWTTLKGKINLSVDSNNETPLRIVIKTKKDSVIWASVSAFFGVEIFRVMLTQDSLYYINHTNKTFYVNKNSEATDFLGYDFSFSEIQEIITGKIKIKKNKYKFDKGFSLLSEKTNYFVNPKTFNIKSIKHNSDSVVLQVKYLYSNQAGEDFFPKEVTIENNSNNNIKLVYTNIILNEKQTTPFKIPRSYVVKK